MEDTDDWGRGMELRRQDLTWTVGVAALGTAVVAGTALSVARSDVLDMPGLNALVRACLLYVAFAAVLVIRSRRSASRMWVVVLVLGLAFATTTLQVSSQPLPYSVGRLMLPGCVLLLLYAFLAYPRGRIVHRESWLAFAAAAAAMGAAWAFTALVASPLPSTGLLSTCVGSCPSNPFAIGGGSPGLVEPASIAVALAEVVAAGSVTAALWIRLRTATPVERVTLDPALPPLVALTLAFAVNAILRVVGADTAAEDVGWVFTPLYLALAVALLIGQLRGRMFAGMALRRTLAPLGPHPDPLEVERRMAAGFGDPSLRIAYQSADGTYMDSSGAPMDVPAGPGPGVRELWDGGERVAVILSDHRLDAAPGFLEAASAASVLALRNARLSAQLQSSVRALRASRARIANAVDGARRQLERELAEGPQLGLATVRARLSEAGARVDGPESRALLSDLGAATAAAAKTLDESAHGIYPRQLVEHGLGAALRTQLGSTPAVIVRGEVGRGPHEGEAAVFFTCLEAVQNGLKHAGEGSRVTVTLREHHGRLDFAVEDDGQGFDGLKVPPGRGLTHIRDRIEAVGGRLSVSSAPGRGTAVAGYVPWGRPAGEREPSADTRGQGTEPSIRQPRSSTT